MLINLIFSCVFLDFAFSSSYLRKEDFRDDLDAYVLSLHEKYAKHIEDLGRKFEDMQINFEEKFLIQDKEIKSLKADLSEKSEIINNLRQEVKILQSRPVKTNADHNSKNEEFIQSNNGTKHQYKDSVDRIYRQERILVPASTNRLAPSNVVAFYAFLSATLPASQAGPNHVLIFDTVKTNIQNAYHPHTGVFIVPEAGVYVFTWSLFIGESNNHHSLELIVNSEVWGEIHAHTTSGVVSESTGIAVVQVNEGDDVYVRSAKVSSNGDVWSNIYGKTFFAGWKL